MSAITAIPIVLGLSALMWLWQERRRHHLGNFLVYAVIVGLIPPLAAAAAAGWSVRAEFVGIAESGSGGASSLTRALQGPATTLLVGVIAFIVIVIAARLLVLGAGPSGAAASSAPRMVSLTLVGAVVAFAASAYVVHAADQVTIGTAARMMPPLVRDAPAPPPAYAITQEQATTGGALGAAISPLERQIPIATWGASALCAILIVATLLGRGVRQSAVAALTWPAAVVAAACAVVALFYANQILGGVRWLAALAESMK